MLEFILCSSSSSTSSLSMEEGYDDSSKLLAAMDRLWFHQMVFSSDPTSVLCSKTALQSPNSSLTSSESSLLEGDNNNNNASIVVSTSSISQNDLNNNDEEEVKVHENQMGRKRSSRLNLIGSKFRSKSSSPSVYRPQDHHQNNSNHKGQKLQRFLSCSKLHDLELEELKGFMDLGFRFDQSQLSPRTMQVLPGLQRVEGQHEDINNNAETLDDEGKKIEDVAKPYLSEAWMVKRPNSPLLRLRMARVSKAEDMKKCLKLWARTVATTVQPDDEQ